MSVEQEPGSSHRVDVAGGGPSRAVLRDDGSGRNGSGPGRTHR
jgi:hypothetical protein